MVEHPEDDSSYHGLNLQGKIALVRGNPTIIHALAIEKYGAAGLIFDNLNDFPPLRTRMDMPDTRQYTSYWWHSEEEKKSFGFVVSPRIGEELRVLAKESQVTLKALVNTELYNGDFENIEYFLPGKKQQEILLVSHLCHPYPGGQDNASGPGTLMEVMRTLTRLIKSGTLPQPELGIRFLMMPEMNGTCAYFEQHPERTQFTIASLNLDMVGADQTKGGGPLCIEQPPMSVPTFVDRFLYKLVQELASNTRNFSGTTEYSTIHYVKTRFSGGSDHYIISDPSIGIPCPMLIQWPDRYYHTTDDSPKNLDPNMMKLVGLTTSLYGYGLANGDEQDWISYLFGHTNRYSSTLADNKAWWLKQNFTVDEFFTAEDFYINYEISALDNLYTYAEVRGFEALKEQLQWSKGILQKEIPILKEKTEREISFGRPVIANNDREEWMEKVYARTLKGPIRLIDEITTTLTLEERVDWLKIESTVPMGYSDFIIYWMDGERTIGDILTLVKIETGMDYPKYVEEFIKLCSRLGLIRELSA